MRPSLRSDDIASATGRLPNMVRNTLDVGFLRERRGGAGRRMGSGGGDAGHHRKDREDYGLVGVLQGWKAALDALEQSHR